MRPVDEIRMDKSAFSIVLLDDPSDEIAYWQTRTPQERLEALELMRQIMYGYDPATARIRRVLEIIPFPPID